MRSREARKAEAWRLIAGEIAVVSILSLGYLAWLWPPWGALVGRFVVLLGAGYLAFHEARPQFTYWRWCFHHHDPGFEAYLNEKSGLGRWVIRVLAWSGKRDLDVQLTVKFPGDVLRRVAGFAAIAIGTLVQIIATWPSTVCP